MSTHLLGVDVGGTFTDVVLADGHGALHLAKVLTTPADPRDGVAAGVTEVLALAGVDASAVGRFVHGTTLATNVILQRRGGPVALVTTEGFADVLRLGREARVEDDRYDLFFAPAEPPVPPQLTFEVRERIGANGDVLVALEPGALDALVAQVTAAAPRGVAVCLLHAYADPTHERAVADALRAALPDAWITGSADVWPEMREYERAMSTVVAALVGPVMAEYLRSLEARLRDLGLRCPVEVMDSAGDVMTAVSAAAHPVATVESGGAAGVLAAGIIGRATGADDVISFDMGGTTAKAAIVRAGRPAVTHDFQVGGKGSFGGARAGTGVPLKVPVVDLAEVGAGGGSIAAVEAGGVLRVGPHSAGSYPGPACYGQGGTAPTVTDADLLLGYLHPSGLAGGVELSVDLARDAVERAIAAPLGISALDAARAIHEIVNANMAAAIRIVTVQRGIDPRGMGLVGFGGAGPMHVARLAETFGIPTVVVPWGAGVASAIGLVSADLGAERVRPFTRDLTALRDGELEAALADLERDARAELDTAASDGEEALVARTVDLRVRGQAHHLGVVFPADGRAADLPELFAQRYREAYGVEPGPALQVTSLRVRIVRRTARHVPTSTTGTTGTTGTGVDPFDATPARERLAHFAEIGAAASTPVYDWATLAPGAQLAGPALVDGTDTTVVVPPGHGAHVDAARNLVLHPYTR
ncbi:MAG: hydantoinase/oxoprolinase family protein [Acidimicrobiia bacterium]